MYSAEVEFGTFLNLMAITVAGHVFFPMSQESVIYVIGIGSM